MSGFKGTPGPWLAREVYGAGYPGQKGYAIDYNEDQEQVTDFVYEETDARLIAAAPELLEVIEICLKAERERRAKLLPGAPATTYTQARIDKIEAAIAKALGTEASK